MVYVDRFNLNLNPLHFICAMILYIINNFPFLKTRYLSILLVARFTFNLEKFTSQHFDEHQRSTPLSRMRNSSLFSFFFPFLSFLSLFFFFLNHNDPSASTTRIQPFFSKFRFFRDKLSEGSSTNSKVLFVRLRFHLSPFAILPFSSPSIFA